MTSSSFSYVGGTVTNILTKIGVTTPVVVAGNTNSSIRVPWFQCTEQAGGTPNLTIDIYDGTTAYYIRNAVAMTAKQAVLFDEGIFLNPGQFLRVTASVINQVDVTGIQSLPNTQA